MFRNAIQLCHFLSTIEEQTQEEMGTNFQGTVFKAMLAKAVAKRNIEVSGAVSGPITKWCVLSQVFSGGSHPCYYSFGVLWSVFPTCTFF